MIYGIHIIRSAHELNPKLVFELDTFENYYSVFQGQISSIIYLILFQYM